MSERGKIKNREYAMQINDFSGLLFDGGITPTDIDMFVEFGDEIFIFGEIKYNGFEMPKGQKLALRRLCDVCFEAKRESVLLVISHDSDGDVNVASSPVVKYRYEKRWHIPQSPTNVRQAIEKIIKRLK
jgi:hypothetical protein